MKFNVQEFLKVRLKLATILMLAWVCGGGWVSGQGREEALVTLNPIPGEGVISEVRPVMFDSVGGSFVFQLKLGFGTDEVFGPGTIFDSFSITLQTEDLSRTWVLATFDASGVVWAPATPGTETLSDSSIARTSINYPSLLPDFSFRHAYALEVALPENATGQPLNLYFDLFNNQNSVASQGWFTDVVVVPEPSVVALSVTGILMLWLLKRRRASRHRANIIALTGFLLGGAVFEPKAAQAEQTFLLNDVSVTLVEVTPDASVYFTSMRLNRALNVWNVEVTISNRSSATLSGPVVLLVDSFSGTSGPQGTDGAADGVKGFYDVSAQISGRGLVPSQKSSPRTLTFGRSGNASPVLTTKVFAGKPPTPTPLGLTRTLNDAGQPLPSVALQVSGPTGVGNNISDRDSGVSSFGQSAGVHTVKFSREGYLPVWRRQMLAASRTCPENSPAAGGSTGLPRWAGRRSCPG